MRELAIRLARAGLSIIPIKPGAKSPAIKSWSEYQHDIMSLSDINKSFIPGCGIGIIGGLVSGGLEIIDFDNHVKNARETFIAFLSIPAVKNIIQNKKIPYERTISGGYHLYYRCNNPLGNKKLARIMQEGNQTPVTLIETRGEGGYVVASPTTGYEIVFGDLANIPMISDEERDIIIGECEKFNAFIKDDIVAPTRDIVITGHDREGDIYNDNPDSIEEVKDILSENGWTKIDSDGKYWTRPGKTDGTVSATFKKVSDSIAPMFYVFSTNAYPFESDRCYDLFGVYTMLKHGGSFKDAAVALRNTRGVGVKERKFRKRLPDVVSDEIKSNESPVEKPKGLKKLPFIELEEFLCSSYEFRFNTYRNIIEYRDVGTFDWDDCNIDTVFCEVMRAGIKVGKELVSSILASDFVDKYDPVREYFEGLPQWDGIDYFKDFSDYINSEDDAFFRDMLEKHFVRTIKCALEDGFYNRFVFVLQSPTQEMGKSRIIKFMNPFGEKYFTDEKLTGDKDHLIALCQNFIYSLEELDDMKKVGIGQVKAILAKCDVNVRLPYGKQNVHMDRKCSFFGTTNLEEFLTDDVNTRWLIFRIKSINWDIFEKININDLWCQAYTLYKSPTYNWDLTKEEKLKRERLNMTHKQSTLEQDLIVNHFDIPNSDYSMSIPEVARALSEIGGFMRLNLNSSYLHDLLTAMGFEVVWVEKFNSVTKRFKICVKNQPQRQ